jgi:predicted AlkP superfamily phosphohydrolase/phosphomutase
MQVALAVEESEHPDLLMVFLPGIDRYSHWLWGGIEPLDRYAPELRPTQEQNDLAGQILRRYYDYTDALIGPLIDHYGEDDLVIALSDHGFERSVADREHPGNHVTAESGDAVLFARGPHVSRKREEVNVLDVTPTILTWLGIASGQDMPGRANAFLEMQAAERVATHDNGTIERLPLVSSGKEEEILDQLKALGYIE